MIHESFYPDGYWRYTRDEFGWANALGAELFFRSLAGDSSTQFAGADRFCPSNPLDDADAGAFHHPSQNTAELDATLGRLLQSTARIPRRH